MKRLSAPNTLIVALKFCDLSEFGLNRLVNRHKTSYLALVAAALQIFRLVGLTLLHLMNPARNYND